MQNNQAQYRVEPAGFWIRFAAYLIDFVIVMFALGIVNVFMNPFMEALKDTPFGKEILFQYTFADIFEYILTMVYFIALTYFTGATLGKKVLNLKVVSAEKDEKLKLFNVVYREVIGRYFSDFLGGIGYLAVVFNDEKKAIHDMLADTKVVKVIKVNPYYAYQQPMSQPAQQPVPQPVAQMMPQQPMEGQTTPKTEVENVEEPYEYTTVCPQENKMNSQEEISRQWERILNPQNEEDQPVMKEESTEGDS